MAELFTQNKKALILVAGIGLILSLVPFYFAEANPGPAEWCGCTGISVIDPTCWIKCVAGYIISLPVRIIFFVIVGVLGIGALIAGFLYAITAVLLNWLTGFIMSVGIVPGNPLTPGIVTAGWDFSRQFANLFFLLALAFIGLATVLRIKEYEMKKALPTLIIIALLINFTPVIVGFVVDIGNIVTKFFLDRMGGISFLGDIMSEAGNYLLLSIRNIFTVDGTFLEPEGFVNVMGNLLGIAIYGLVLLIFFSLAGLIYLLIAAVFFCRTVILWVLMILSPIAFLSKVFPSNKTTKMVFPDILHWDKWWEKLIQWTIIGIPISFFLYLSNSILLNRGDFEAKFGVGSLETGLIDIANQTSLGGVSLSTVINATFASFFANLLAPVLSLMILAIGALISFRAVPESAKGIMRFTTERGAQGASRIRSGIRRMSDTYYATKKTRPDLTGRQILGQVIRREFEGRPWKAWAWQKKQRPPSTATSAAGKTSTEEPPWGIDQGTGPEEALRQAPSAPTPTPPVSKRTKAGRFARGFLIVEPLKIGLWAGKGILKAARDTAIPQVEKELKMKTKTCPNCGETNIPAKVKFCPECGQPLS